jgi:histone-lysine N-methyltransferase SETMAR
MAQCESEADFAVSDNFPFPKNAIRAIIFYNWRRGLSVDQCKSEMDGALGNSSPSKPTIYRWYADFQRGRSTFEDEARSGRPPSAVTQQNIDAVRELVENDPHVTYEMIEHQVDIGSHAVCQILHDHLKLRKICARWVPHFLTNEQKVNRVNWCQQMLQKYERGRSRRVSDIVTGDETWIYYYDPPTKRQSTVWIGENEPRPTKVKKSRSVGKRMFAMFFSRSKMVAKIMLQNQRTVTAAWYVNECLPKLFAAVEQKRPKSGIRGLILHHDNAPAHTAHLTLSFLEESSVQLMSHPPYSPDLAPCDFWLFPKLKERLRGRRFESEDELKLEIDEALSNFDNGDYANCFGSWFDRMEKCIDREGDYFEQQ